MYRSGNNYQPTLSNLTFTLNKAVGDEGKGGAVYLNCSTLALTSCVITQNSAVYGGGVYIGHEKATYFIRDVNISKNTALVSGGGIYNIESPSDSFLTYQLLGDVFVFGNTANNTMSLEANIACNGTECSSTCPSPSCEDCGALCNYFVNDSNTQVQCLNNAGPVCNHGTCSYQKAHRICNCIDGYTGSACTQSPPISQPTIPREYLYIAAGVVGIILLGMVAWLVRRYITKRKTYIRI